MPVRTLDAVLLQVPELGLRQLALGNRVVGDLDRVVTVRVLRFHADDGVWLRFDHGHGRDVAGLRIEDPRHPQLPAHDPFHVRA